MDVADQIVGSGFSSIELRIKAGDLAKVKKAPSGEFTIEHYMD
ncbi:MULTISPECIES: hypothetical protein [unclassified Vibrio]|nr:MULTISPECIES: hypothetical protein [unclassified Vibrio]